jgi:hypothetical protein
MIASLRQGASLAIGIDHDNYRHQLEPVSDSVRDALIADLD